MLALLPPLPQLLKLFARAVTSHGDDKDTWLRDPLSHPTIAAMSGEQLADLPAAELRARVRC